MSSAFAAYEYQPIVDRQESNELAPAVKVQDVELSTTTQNTNLPGMVYPQVPDLKVGSPLKNVIPSLLDASDPWNSVPAPVGFSIDRSQMSPTKTTNDLGAVTLAPNQPTVAQTKPAQKPMSRLDTEKPDQQSTQTPLLEPTTDAYKTLVPAEYAKLIGFYSIEEIIKKFQGVALQELIKANTQVKFLENVTKNCWQLTYADLKLECAASRDNFNDRIVHKHATGYVKQLMHSISGEQKDLCFYSYSAYDMIRFLEQNKHLKYTYLPITVHATDSANSIRHDMLLIFNNRTKFFYWFDGRNRTDYLQFGKEAPRDSIDILFTLLAEQAKLGYSYEPSQSWQIQDVLQPYPPLGQLDFAFSAALCYMTIMMLDNYDSPMEYLSVLDTLSRTDRFHLMYNSLLHMAGVFKYHTTVPINAQINFNDERIPQYDEKISQPAKPANTAVPANNVVPAGNVVREITPLISQPIGPTTQDTSNLRPRNIGSAVPANNPDAPTKSEAGECNVQ